MAPGIRPWPSEWNNALDFLKIKPWWKSTAKCAALGCDSPKGKKGFFCEPWIERHIRETI